MNIIIMFLVVNMIVFRRCSAEGDTELQIQPKRDAKMLELRHNITADFDGSGGLPYRYRRKFFNHGIIPDVIPLAPKNILKVKWGWRNIHLGTKMLAEKLKKPPKLSWPTENGIFYTLLMTSPDFPTREMPTEKEWIYWRVGNIPGNDIGSGNVIDAYCGPPVYFERTSRRFVLLVYKQPIAGKSIKFEEITEQQVLLHERAQFSTLKFAEKYGFDIYPHAGNFFLVDGIEVK